MVGTGGVRESGIPRWDLPTSRIFGKHQVAKLRTQGAVVAPAALVFRVLSGFGEGLGLRV